MHMHPLSKAEPPEHLPVPTTWWSPWDQDGSQVCRQPGLVPVGARNRLGEQRVWTSPGAVDVGHFPKGAPDVHWGSEGGSGHRVLLGAQGLRFPPAFL